MNKVKPKEARKIEIFISYSSEDRQLQKELVNHLSILEREGNITVWHEDKIQEGAERDDEVNQHLNSADIIVLLISSDLVASDKWDNEVSIAMTRHKEQKTCVIPVLLRDVILSKEFNGLTILPSGEQVRAIASWTNKDRAFKNVTEGIEKAVNQVSGQKINLLQEIRKQLPRTSRKDLLTMVLASMGVTVLVAITRLSAVLEPIELLFFDQMVRLQAAELIDNRLLLIEITPDDIKTFGSGNVNSLPDKVISDLLEILLKNQPNAIGLDLYREIETKETEHKKLSQFFKNTDNFFAVCKVADPQSNSAGTTPPPEVPKKRIGFSDFSEDRDLIVRRQILQMYTKEITKNPCIGGQEETINSLSLQLSQHYLSTNLNTKGKEYKTIKNIFSSGDVVLQLLSGATTGGYQSELLLSGYQVILNYRSVCSNDGTSLPRCSPHKIAKKIKVQDLMEYPNNDISKSPQDKKNKDINIKNKIILIGTNRDGIDTKPGTPFSGGGREPALSGLTMQAQMVSQLVSAVEDKRPLIQVWYIGYEVLWILFWSLIGSILAQLFRRPKNIIISGSFTLISLYVSCLILFLFPKPVRLWVPLVPPALSLLMTGGTVIYLRIKPQNFS